MSLFDDIRGFLNRTSPDDERLYEIVAHEIAQGGMRPGLWTKALSESGYDEQKAKALYIKLRVRALEQEITAELNNRRQKSPGKDKKPSGNTNALGDDTADEKYQSALGKTRCILRDPIPADAYAKKYGLTIDQVMEMIKQGQIWPSEYYESEGFLFVEDKPVRKTPLD